MTNRDIAKNNMYKQVKRFFNTHYAVFNGFARLLLQITLFGNLNDKLDDCIKTQGKVSTGVADNKATALLTVAALIVKASRKLLVYAKDQQNAVLMAILDIRAFDLTNSSYTNNLTTMENVLEAIKGITAPLEDYRVSAADIAAIDAGIATCKAVQAEPGDARSSREAATKGIVVTMGAIDECLGVLDDLIVSEYADTHAALVEQYQKDRRIDNTAIRHSGIAALVSNGTLAEGIEMKVEKLNKSAVTDINGKAEISPMRPGTYLVLFTGGHYLPQTVKLTVPKGKIIEVKVEMVKA